VSGGTDWEEFRQAFNDPDPHGMPIRMFHVAMQPFSDEIKRGRKLDLRILVCQPKGDRAGCDSRHDSWVC
jgi:hypothetical protein